MKKPVIIGIVILLILAGIISSIFIFKKKSVKVVFTTGLKSSELFKIDSEVCTVPEAMIFLTTAENQYDSMFDSDIWSEEFDGKTLEGYLKDETVAQLSQMMCMELLAKEKGLTLTTEETSKIKEAAKEYYNGLTQEEITYMGITKEDVANLYSQYTLANKIYSELTADVKAEVSDDEARIMTAQQVFVSKNSVSVSGDQTADEVAKTEAEKILQRAIEGEDFTILTESNKDAESVLSFGRDDMPETYVNAAFNLEDGEISEVVETDEGYYIIKCISHLDRDLTDENKENIQKERKEKAFREVYDKFVSDLNSEFNDKAWEKIQFKQQEKVTTISFFDTYYDYFQ